MMRRIDLLPSAYAEKRRERRNIGLVMLAGLAVLALLLFYWVILGTRVNDKQEELAAIEATNTSLQNQIAELQNFQALSDELDAKQASLLQVTALDVDWPAVLTEIALVAPPDVWLTQLTGSRLGSEGETPVATETAEIRITKNQPAGRIAFAGRALDMPDVATWLLRLKDVRGATAIYLNNALEEELEGQEVITFDSSVELTQKVLSNRFAEGADQ
jgi:Tfp pilus assembly protein PilN